VNTDCAVLGLDTPESDRMVFDFELITREEVLEVAKEEVTVTCFGIG